MNINDAFPTRFLKAENIKGGPPVTVTIEKVTLEEMPGDGDAKQSRPVLWFVGKEKGVVLNKTNGQMIAHTYGDEMDLWVGKAITLRSEPVSFQGRIVDSIRVAVAQVAQPQFNDAPPPSPEQYASEQQATQANIDQYDDPIPF